jgi:hypothetical protein
MISNLIGISDRSNIHIRAVGNGCDIIYTRGNGCECIGVITGAVIRALVLSVLMPVCMFMAVFVLVVLTVFDIFVVMLL